MDETAPHYLGHAMKFWSTVYNWAEAGYALNRPALDRLFTKFKNKVIFLEDNGEKLSGICIHGMANRRCTQ
jgi:hypothetical protein